MILSSMCYHSSLNDRLNNRVNAVIVNPAEDKASMTVPPNKDQLQYWLNQTPYGSRYLAIIQSRITPLYLWGSRERVL